MSTLTSYNGLRVVAPDPTGNGGLAINNNFKALSTHVSTLGPTSGNDSSQGFVVGSRWYNSTTTVESICLDNTASAAVWVPIASDAYLSLAGGTLTGDVQLTSATYTWYQLTAGILTAFGGDGHLGTQISENQLQTSNFYVTGYPTYINVGSPSILSGGLSIVGGNLNANGNDINLNTGGGTGGQTLNMDGALLQNIGYGTTAPTLAGDSQFAFSYDESTNLFTITVKRSDGTVKTGTVACT